jgi:glucose-1-phosphate adenylyltransferase
MNSGIRRIGVITQYKSHSLLRHLQRGWAFLKSEMNEFVDLLPAQQRVDEESWYRGTADAVYQNQDILAAYRADYVVVLAGDHIYKQNYASCWPTTWPWARKSRWAASRCRAPRPRPLA